MNKILMKTFAIAIFLVPFVGLAAAKPSTIKLVSPANGAVVQSGVSQIIRWTTENYPAGASVNINLLRKVSSNPDKFELVKIVKKNTSNDGSETWTPSDSEKGGNMMLQVSCSNSVVFPGGCSATQGGAQIAIVDSSEKNSYIAGAISAIQAKLAEIIKEVNLLLKK